WQHAHTRDPLRSLHHAVLSPTGDASAPEAAFRRCYVDRDDGERYTTLVAGAGRCFNAGDYLYAARQDRGLVALDPGDVRLHYLLGQACVEAAVYDEAIVVLTHGESMGGAEAYDFAFELGRACYLAAMPDAAIGHYERSIARAPHAETWSNLGMLW